MWQDELKELLVEASYWTGKEDDIMNFIKALLKEQRKNCADEATRVYNITTDNLEIDKGSILNAPEPKGIK